MRGAVLAAAMCLSMVGLSAAADAEASILSKQPTNIPAQGLAQALNTLAKERGLQLVFRSEVVGRARTRGASGDLTTAEALAKLLEGTDLSYAYLDEKTVTILPPAEVGPSPATVPSSSALPTVDAQPQEGKKSFWDSFRVAQATGGTAASSSSVAASSSSGADVAQSSSSSSQLEEVLVTAQKKTERLQDVPIPVSVLSAEDLTSNNQTLL